MLKYIEKNSKTITLIIVAILIIAVCILLDFLNIQLHTNKNNSNIYKGEITKYAYLQRKAPDEKTIKLEDSFLKPMQIAAIYENTNVNTLNEEENIEDILDVENKWRIEIPKISLNAPIKSGTTQDVLAVAVGHFEESNVWNGNVALAGHNRGYNCNFFEKIKYLEEGDKIIYHTKYGIREYEVVLSKIIKQTDWSYIANTGDNRITLITCVENMYEYRRCIQAVEI